MASRTRKAAPAHAPERPMRSPVTPTAGEGGVMEEMAAGTRMYDSPIGPEKRQGLLGKAGGFMKRHPRISAGIPATIGAYAAYSTLAEMLGGEEDRADQSRMSSYDDHEVLSQLMGEAGDENAERRWQDQVAAHARQAEHQAARQMPGIGPKISPELEALIGNHTQQLGMMAQRMPRGMSAFLAEEGLI